MNDVTMSNKNYTMKTVRYNPHGRKEGSVLFNDALNTFYLQLHCVGRGGGGEVTDRYYYNGTTRMV